MSARIASAPGLTDNMVKALQQKAPSVYSAYVEKAQGDLVAKVEKLREMRVKAANNMQDTGAIDSDIAKFESPEYQQRYIKDNIIRNLGFTGNRIATGGTALDGLQGLNFTTKDGNFQKRAQRANQILSRMRGMDLEAVEKETGIDLPKINGQYDNSPTGLLRAYGMIQQARGQK
jgi:hypothetical protein